MITRYLPGDTVRIEGPTIGPSELRNKEAQLVDRNNELEDTVDVLLEVNERFDRVSKELEQENQKLEEELTVVKADNKRLVSENLQLTDLNQRMQERMDRMSVAGLRATGFQVALLKDEAGKLTSKASKVRGLQVSFDMENVPESHQGRRSLYLVVTNKAGNPVLGANPVKAKVPVNRNTVELLALTGRDVELTGRQRVALKQDLQQKLDPGNYRIQVFSDLGLVGTAGFTVE